MTGIIAEMICSRTETRISIFLFSKRMLERGGRRDIFLGTRECQGYVEPCKFGEGESVYDNTGSMSFGIMVHGLDYPSETGKEELAVRLWNPVMKNGIIEFIKPDECTIRRKIRDMETVSVQTSGFSEPGLLDGYEREDAK